MHQSLTKEQYNKLMEKAEECVEICSIFTNFEKDKTIPFSKMKEELKAFRNKSMTQSAR